MPGSNYLFTTREQHPALDVSLVFIGPTITGTFSFTSSAATSLSMYPNISLSYSGVRCGLDSCYLVPLFSGTVPKRFIFEMSLSKCNPSNSEGDFFWAIGTENSSSANVCAMGFNLKGDKFFTITNGVFSASNNTFTQAWLPAADNLNYIRKEFEMQTQTPQTGSEIAFRCREFTSTSEENSTFQYDTIYKSHVDFPFENFPSGWYGKTFNKLYLGYTYGAGGVSSNGQFLIDSIRVKKHYMDWDE